MQESSWNNHSSKWYHKNHLNKWSIWKITRPGDWKSLIQVQASTLFINFSGDPESGLGSLGHFIPSKNENLVNFSILNPESYNLNSYLSEIMIMITCTGDFMRFCEIWINLSIIACAKGHTCTILCNNYVLYCHRYTVWNVGKLLFYHIYRFLETSGDFRRFDEKWLFFHINLVETFWSSWNSAGLEGLTPLMIWGGWRKN